MFNRKQPIPQRNQFLEPFRRSKRGLPLIRHRVTVRRSVSFHFLEIKTPLTNFLQVRIGMTKCEVFSTAVFCNVSSFVQQCRA